MTYINRWKMIALALIVPALIAMQPIVSYACTGAGSHGGCGS